MKKTIVFLTLLLAGSTFAQDAGFYDDGGSYPFQIGFYPTLQLVPYDQDVTGVRISLIGCNRNMTGLDLGIINQSDESFRGIAVAPINLSKGDAGGIQIGFINHVNGDVVGIQGIPLVSWYHALNIVHGQITGLQGGFYNQAETLSGMQGGAINVAYNSKGGMVGLYNYSDSMGGIGLGLVNVAYEDAHGLQIGLYNGAGHMRGLQLGVVNQAQTIEGLQLGLVNVVSQKEWMPVMVIANWQF